MMPDRWVGKQTETDLVLYSRVELEGCVIPVQGSSSFRISFRAHFVLLNNSDVRLC